ncbi:MAG: DUF4178 domain-containing protein, partial [Planctomycetota bacterium]
MAAEVSCPGCGAAVIFEVGSSIVRICEFCESAVARGDRDPEDLGKVAALIDTPSILSLGLRGTYAGVGFQLVGHSQLENQAGGTWDEWYANFSDGRWGWLAEAQGKFYLTFEKEIPEKLEKELPSFDALGVGRSVKIGKDELVVAEKGEAKYVGAAGEIPFRWLPGGSSIYADLAGGRSRFVTLQYEDDGIQVYTGREVRYEDLNIDEGGGAVAEKRAKRAEALHLNCPQCGGALEIRVPDRTERVGCPSCGSLLDAAQGKLSFLAKAAKFKGTPQIPLGTKGKIDGVEYTAIGFLRRSVTVSGSRYPWSEYLLYQPKEGFRWLVQSDNHWSFVTPLAPGEAKPSLGGVKYEGKNFKIFQKEDATVEVVLGEFYWRVHEGETVLASDYIKPPFQLSEEVSYVKEPEEDNDDEEPPKKGKKQKRKRKKKLEKGEVTWALGRYIPVEDVESAFGVKRLPRPTGIAPNEPFKHSWVYRPWMWLAGTTVVLFIFALILSAGNVAKVWKKSVKNCTKQNTHLQVACNLSTSNLCPGIRIS